MLYKLFLALIFSVVAINNSFADENYQENDTIVLQFSATWCSPCHALQRVIKNSQLIQSHLKRNTRGYFIVDVDSKDANARQWIKIARPTRIPLVVLYKYTNKRWTEARRFIGLKSAIEVLGFLKRKKNAVVSQSSW